MKHLHFDLFSGASGDMFLGALVDLGCPVAHINDTLGRLGLPGLAVKESVVSKKGTRCVKIDVIEPEGKRLKHFSEVSATLSAAELSSFVRARSLAAFRAIAAAEAKIHSSTIEKIHFHELGSLDTIADIVGAFCAVEYLGVDSFSCTPIALGRGVVKISHGAVPIPAPATLEILRGFVIDPAPLEGERTTPTGAAILRELISPSQSDLPPGAHRILGAGYGAGTADFSDRVNFLRATMYEIGAQHGQVGVVTQLDSVIDDMNPQIFGHVLTRLYDSGCLEAYITPVQMKKGRPGWNITVLCEPSADRRLAEILLTETTSAGVRRSVVDRIVLEREFVSVDTPYGPVRVKKFTSSDGVGTLKVQPEYDDCAALATACAAPVRDVIAAALRAVGATDEKPKSLEDRIS